MFPAGLRPSGTIFGMCRPPRNTLEHQSPSSQPSTHKHGSSSCDPSLSEQEPAEMYVIHQMNAAVAASPQIELATSVPEGIGFHHRPATSTMTTTASRETINPVGRFSVTTRHKQACPTLFLPSSPVATSAVGSRNRSHIIRRKCHRRHSRTADSPGVSVAFLKIESLSFLYDTIPLRWTRNETSRSRGSGNKRQSAARDLPPPAIGICRR